MGGNASVPTDPNRTLQVIGAGYSRTGTLSMAFALEKLLDGPVMHGGSQLLGREDGGFPILSLSSQMIRGSSADGCATTRAHRLRQAVDRGL
jgi:hypothetical protein